MKKITAIILLLILVLCNACSTQSPTPEITPLNYTDSSKSYRVTEPYNPNILFGEKTKDACGGPQRQLVRWSTAAVR